ncbi:hypothetical protein NQ315_001743 [Exocentrus adspersus]|uniref:Tyrosine--tRNA ligase n=1 Tax=Exocentrus adspersus TaxID=1586481 RepID=A0AAV8W9N6_9CUCU|nr:hypothetical protein NQ315_001743 [Exocentrus adspersus]
MNGILKCRKVLRNLQRSFSNRNILSLRKRGMFHEIFPDNSAATVVDLLNRSTRTVYAGFDPTADSLHVGNLLVLINLLHWQRGGHRCIALIGGATAKIGDPSGKSKERDVLSTAFVDSNIHGIHRNIQTVFSNHEKYLWNDKDPLAPLIILNNEDWYSKINSVELIGGAGRHLRMGTLLSRTSVQTRLNSPVGMSFTEFSYQLFQAYDWLHLFKEHKCMFQIGGNDQMGNIMSGQELISKICKEQVYGLTVPLVTTEMGDKFGKTSGNAVWLDAEKTSSFLFYQFWMRQPDSEVQKFLKLFTFDTVGNIDDTMRQHRENPEKRIPQKRLAEQVTLLVHGEEGLKKAQEAATALYEGSVAALGNMNTEDIAQLFSGASVVGVLPEAGMDVIELAMKVGCFSRKEDAVRIISAGGFYINQQKAINPSEVVTDVHRLQNNVTLLRVGKKNYYIVKWLS